MKWVGYGTCLQRLFETGGTGFPTWGSSRVGKCEEEREGEGRGGEGGGDLQQVP